MPIEKPEGRVCDSKNGPRFRLQERAQRSQQSIWLKEYTMLCCAQFLQSSPTFCDPMDCSPPSSSVHGFSRQEYWSGLPCPPPGDLPNSRIQCVSHVCLHWQAGSLPLVPPGKPTWLTLFNSVFTPPGDSPSHRIRTQAQQATPQTSL